MCVIAAYESNFPKLEELEAMEALNKDGAGIAWIFNGKVRWKKGLTAKEIIDTISKENIKLPLVVHFRIATVGGVRKDLCHPFPVSAKVPLALEGEADAVLFHNGNWHDWRETCMKTCISGNVRFPSGVFSDSRAMAWLAFIYGRNFLSLIGGANKITVLTPKGIKKFGDGWTKVGDAMCSNDHFASRKTSQATYSRNWSDTKKEEGELDKESVEAYEELITKYKDVIGTDEVINVDVIDEEVKKLEPIVKAKVKKVTIFFTNGTSMECTLDELEEYQTGKKKLEVPEKKVTVP